MPRKWSCWTSRGGISRSSKVFCPPQVAMSLLESEFQTELGRLSNLPNDRDRLRVIRSVATNYRFTSTQAIQMLQASHFGGAGVEAALLLYPRLTDRENWEAMVEQGFQCVAKLCSDFHQSHHIVIGTPTKSSLFVRRFRSSLQLAQLPLQPPHRTMTPRVLRLP